MTWRTGESGISTMSALARGWVQSVGGSIFVSRECQEMQHGASGRPLSARPPQVQLAKAQQRGGGWDVELQGMCFLPIFISLPSLG